MQIRDATLADVSAILEVVLKYTAHLPVLPDKTKIKKLIVVAISTKSNFCQVTTEEGQVTGALVALCQQGMWFERVHLHLLFLATSSKGGGLSMLRNLLKWSKDRRGIKVVSADFLVPDRVGAMLERVGLAKTGSSYILFK
jgi:hypothetical protein